MIKEKVRWNYGVSLFVNATPADGIDCYDIWHNGGPGGPMFTAHSQEAAEEICSAINELNELRAEVEYLRKESAADIERDDASQQGRRMTKKQTALARRAVVHNSFEWMPGMMRQDGCRYIGSGLWARWSDTAAVVTALHMPEQYPDLTDPATLGCIVTLTRAAWKDKGLYACLNHRGWSVPVYAYSVDCTNAGSMAGRYYTTESEAWIHSFLAAE